MKHIELSTVLIKNWFASLNTVDIIVYNGKRS